MHTVIYTPLHGHIIQHWILYSLDQTLWLLFISSTNFVQLLFKRSNYSRAEFTSLSQSCRWRRRDQSSIGWLLDRKENLLLVVADWFTSLFWGCFTSSQLVFACPRATQVFVMPTAATIWERLLNKGGILLSGYGKCGHAMECISLCAWHFLFMYSVSQCIHPLNPSIS